MSHKEKNTKKIAAEKKAIAIIESCKNCNHITITIAYLDLYLKIFNDKKTNEKLNILLKTKQKKLNCYAD